MKVAVIINGRAGRSDRELIERKVRQSLFRCDLEFIAPEDALEMSQTVAVKAAEDCDYLVVCGGDGTLNVAVQPLVRLKLLGYEVPPLCPIPVGTANDLARELKISSRIDEAARMIMEGDVKTIDVVAVTSDGRTSFMLTNGGLGVPAETAMAANRVREWLHARAECPNTKFYYRPFLKAASRTIKATGDGIYEVLLAGTLSGWDRGRWAVELETPDGHRFTTRAPFIMINNQRYLGGKYQTAPLTLNSDGLFNVLLMESSGIFDQARTLLQVRQGDVLAAANCPSFETRALKVRALERSLTFFGDGEILHRGVRELEITCVHPGIPVVIQESA